MRLWSIVKFAVAAIFLCLVAGCATGNGGASSQSAAAQAPADQGTCGSTAPFGCENANLVDQASAAPLTRGANPTATATGGATQASNSSQATTSSSASSAEDHSFPWPPPVASSRQEIPDKFLVADKSAKPTISSVAARIEEALDENGYGDVGYLSLPHGVAMITRRERINEDGTPDAQHRWFIGPIPASTFGQYLAQLISAPQGRYRVIVFVLTSDPLSYDEHRTTSEKDLLGLANSGYSNLPPELDGPYTAKYKTTALVYEIDAGTGLVIPPQGPHLDAKVHLEKAGIWATLQGK